MRTVKTIITVFFLLLSYFSIYLIFNRYFWTPGLTKSVDDHTENTFMLLLTCTGLSGVAILCSGIISMFTHFVFVKIAFSQEIKEAAYFLLKNKRKNGSKIDDLLNTIRNPKRNKEILNKIYDSTKEFTS